MAGFLDISGLSHFKKKLLEAISATYMAKADTYTKTEIENLVGTSSGGADAAELCHQMIDFYNGYTGESLDYRDYLDHNSTDLLASFYGFGEAYQGAVNGTAS